MSREGLEKRGNRPYREKSMKTEEVIEALQQLLDHEEALGVKKMQRFNHSSFH